MCITVVEHDVSDLILQTTTNRLQTEQFHVTQKLQYIAEFLMLVIIQMFKSVADLKVYIYIYIKYQNISFQNYSKIKIIIICENFI